jgi:hypothetical protein
VVEVLPEERVIGASTRRAVASATEWLGSKQEDRPLLKEE